MDAADSMGFLMDLNKKNSFKPEIRSDASQSGFDGEMKFIEGQIAKIREGMGDDFFMPSHTKVTRVEINLRRTHFGSNRRHSRC